MIVLSVKKKYAVVLIDIFDAPALYEGKVDPITEKIMKGIVEDLSKERG